MKIKGFEHKLIYYAVYNKNTKSYNVIHDYDKPLSVLYFYIFNYVLKLNYAGITFLDLGMILHAENLVVVTTYVLNGKIYNDVFDVYTYEKPRTINHNKVVYAYTNTDDDLTHEFERFKNTIFDVKLDAQQLYNVIMGYRQKQPEKVLSIKVMMDNDFIENQIQSI
jgi:hypothetical protein